MSPHPQAKQLKVACLVTVVVALLPVLSMPVVVRADCINYADHLRLLGSLATPDDGYDVFAYGDFAAIAQGASGLQLVDIQSPTLPALLGSVDTPGFALGVVVSGGLAYVADGDSGLQVIDIANPMIPKIVGSVATPGRARRVAVNGAHAYVAAGVSGLQVIDIRDPSSPHVVKEVSTSDEVTDVSISGEMLYMAAGWQGILIVDISNPDTPAIRGRENSDRARDIAVSGSYAYISDWSWTFRVVNISNPYAPKRVGGFEIPEINSGTSSNLTVCGNYVYMADISLRVIDVTVPSNPQISGTLGMVGFIQGAFVRDLEAYVIASAGGHRGLSTRFYVVDVTHPSSPGMASNVDTEGSGYEVDVAGSYAFVADGAAGVAVVDVTDANGARLVGRIDTPGAARAIKVMGSYAYVADGQNGLQIIDVSNPVAPKLVSAVDSPGDAWDIAIADTYAYLVDGGLLVVNVSDPASPEIVGGSLVPASRGIAVSDQYAFVAGYWDGLHVLDISDPTSPIVLGSVDTPGTANGVAVLDGYAYVADGIEGVQVISVSEPSSPWIVTTVAMTGGAYDIVIDKGFAYVSGWWSGLKILDLSVPAMPTLVGTALSYSHGVCVANSAVYLADGSGLTIMPEQCSITTSVLLSDLRARSESGHIVLDWATAAESEFAGFLIHRSLDPVSGYRLLDAELLRPPSPYRYVDRDVVQGILYFYRLEALDRTGDREFFGPVSARVDPNHDVEIRPALGQAFPNPVQDGSSTIPFAVSRNGNVKIRVLDLAGKEVRLLLDEVLEMGERTASWDGRSGRGEMVPAGIYLYQLQTPGFEATRKLVRLR